MGGSEKVFPRKTVADLVLDAVELQEFRNESILFNSGCNVHLIDGVPAGYCTHVTTRNYKTRYEFSNYIIDPHKFRFRRAVGFLGLVYLFIIKCRSSKAKSAFSKKSSSDWRTIPKSGQ